MSHRVNVILEDEVWAALPMGHASALLDFAPAAFDVALAGSLVASWSAGCLGLTITAVPRELLIPSGGEEWKGQGVD